MIGLKIDCVVFNMQMPEQIWGQMDLSEFVANFSLFSIHIYFGLFPSFSVLNAYLMTGEQNEGMGNNAEWYPFCLTQMGFDELFDEVKKLKFDKNIRIFESEPATITHWKYQANKILIPLRRKI